MTEEERQKLREQIANEIEMIEGQINSIDSDISSLSKNIEQAKNILERNNALSVEIETNTNMCKENFNNSEIRKIDENTVNSSSFDESTFLKIVEINNNLCQQLESEQANIENVNKKFQDLIVEGIDNLNLYIKEVTEIISKKKAERENLLMKKNSLISQLSSL